jgi:hypothetical protein
MSSPFSGVAIFTATVIHEIHGQPARLVPRKVNTAKGPNAPRVVENDTSRPETACRVVRAEFPERFNVADNGIGRNSGRMSIAPTSLRCLVTFPEGMISAPRKGDLLTFDDRPNLEYELGETMPGSLPGITFAYALKG